MVLRSRKPFRCCLGRIFNLGLKMEKLEKNWDFLGWMVYKIS